MYLLSSTDFSSRPAEVQSSAEPKQHATAKELADPGVWSFAGLPGLGFRGIGFKGLGFRGLGFKGFGFRL